jgi:hypothetical protein
VVERLPVEREPERVGLRKRRVDPRSPEVSAREFELLRLDVDAEESGLRELLTEDREHGADAAADLEQACSRLERRAVTDQSLSPVLCLLDEPLLLARPVAMNVTGYGKNPATASAAGPMSFWSS